VRPDGEEEFLASVDVFIGICDIAEYEAMCLLQWYVLVLAIIATIATIISAFAAWSNIVEFLKTLGFQINNK
jgi:hypothetical protein